VLGCSRSEVQEKSQEPPWLKAEATRMELEKTSRIVWLKNDLPRMQLAIASMQTTRHYQLLYSLQLCTHQLVIQDKWSLQVRNFLDLHVGQKFAGALIVSLQPRLLGIITFLF